MMALEQLFESIVKEKDVLGEALLRKVKINTYQSAEKDVYGFEMKG